jgi:hypothetical protein
MLMTLRAFLPILLSAPLLLAGTPDAGAAGVCSGTLSGSPLRPIAKPVVVSLEHRIDSTANPELAKQFLAGVQSAGVSVVPQGQGTTTLDLSFLLQGKRKGSYRDLNWMRGSAPSGDVKSSLQGSRIDVTVYARDAASRSLVWTGAITCTIQTDDMGALAEGLGATVGRSIGQSIPKTAL